MLNIKRNKVVKYVDVERAHTSLPLIYVKYVDVDAWELCNLHQDLMVTSSTWHTNWTDSLWLFTQSKQFDASCTNLIGEKLRKKIK